MSSWYAPLVWELGLANATQDKRWKSGCFYRPPNHSCADALRVPEATGAVAGSPGGTGCMADSLHLRTPHVRHACARLAEYYTPELAAVVTATFRRDLERFNYPVWDGDVAHPWH